MGWSTTRAGTGLFTAALLGALAPGALAQNNAPSSGFYIGGGVGANFQEENRFRGGGGDSNTSYDAGYIGLLNLGYGLGNGLRLELEPGWRHNDADVIGGSNGRGGTDVGSLMVNGLYDLNTPMFGRWQPHLGLGVGAARVHNHTASANTPLVYGNDTVPAFQGIAGIDYPVTPQLKLGVDYRYFLAHDTDFHVAATHASVSGGDFNDHAILLTFRYSFGAPPAPPPEPAAAMSPPAKPAPPPPPMARNYTVYFDLDQATLTASGRAVVRAAAQSAKQNQVTHIDATGYTDTTGTARYNQRLSERRAATVRAELIADGVPPDQIVTRGMGENDLAVPTAQGVNEPRNRRVVIIVQGPGT